MAFWNPAAETIFGYPAKEILGKDAHEFLAPNDQYQKATKGVHSFLKTGKGKLVGSTIEVNARHKNGHLLQVEISLSSYKNANGNYQAVAIIRDITERKAAEKQVRESNIFLQTLLNTIPVPIFHKNAKGEYEGGNPAFFEFIGQKPEDVIGKSVYELNGQKNFADAFGKMDKELFKNHKKQVYEWKVKNSRGESRDVVFHKAIYKNSQDEVAGIVGIFIDITESKKITSELRELKESLEQKVSKRTEQLREANATKDKFFSIIAHDLKSPFNIIQGFLTLIHDEFESFTEMELKEFIGKTLEASTNTFTLLENLLEWSRSQRGTIHFNPEVIQLGEICNEVIFQSTDYAKQKNIDVTLDIAPNHQVFADPEMIMTILRNLVSNAVKFSNPGDPVNIISKETPEYMEICVKDYGIGMNENFRKNLFNLSEKTQRNGTNKEKGTGLGLILCREFIEKNNGKLWVKSRENKGSSFYFSLPLPNNR